MTKNEIVGRLKAGGLDASSTNRSAAVYVADAMAGRAAPGWFAYRIVCDSEATERRVRAILSRWYDIDVNGSVWRLRSKNRVPLMAIKRGGVPPAPPTPTGDYMYFEAQEANSTVSMTSTLETAPNFEYSTDGVAWQEWQHTTSDGTHTFDTLTLTGVGDRVYLRGDNPNGLGTLPEGAKMPLFSHFEMTGKIAAGGNIMRLLAKDTEITEIPAYGFTFLFSSYAEASFNTSLTAAAAMPNVTTIGDGGCAYMYGYCTSLTAAAAMPNVTTIGDGGCAYMYGYCTSLTAAAAMPQLTTIDDGGCAGMYSGCTSLTAAANMPQLTTIGDGGCEVMYAACTFDMSDDGTTLNFEFQTPPITAGETTYSTAYDVAEWMGNTNGFTQP